MKLKTRGLIEDNVNAKRELRDLSRDDLESEVSLIAKSFGIYMEFNRDKARVNQVKDWIYMVRVVIPGGGPILPKQWRILDDISNKYTISDAYTGYPSPSLKITTRQDIQLHHIKKKDLVNVIREIGESGFFTLNGCGDNVRNTVSCPITRYSNVFDPNELARKIANYFKLPTGMYIQVFEIDPEQAKKLDERLVEGHFQYPDNLLPRKFKIGIAGIVKLGDKYYVDDCIDVRANDVGIVPIVSEEGMEFQIYVGGSLGENNANPSFSALALPIGIVEEGELIKTLDAIVRIQAEWGDRKNRHWARFKYVVYMQGIEWIRQKIKEYSGVEIGPIKNIPLVKDLHLGWYMLNDKWAFGMFVENGRVIDGKNGKIKSIIRYIADNFEHVKFYTTANQHLIIAEINDEEKERIGKLVNDLNKKSNLRIYSTACVGFPTCKLSFTDSERYLPKVIDELEKRGWGNSLVSIGLSGCVAQCSRPSLHPIGWIGSGYELYMLKIGGDNQHCGEPLIDYDENVIYLYQVPSLRVIDVTEALMELYERNKEMGNTPGEVFRRLGNKKIIEWLKSHEKTKDLMRPHKFDRKIEGYKEFHNLLTRRLEEVRKFSE